MPARRVLVTGVSGFVGAHLAAGLAERGDQVLGIGLEPPSPDVHGRLTAFLNADIGEIDSLRAALEAARPEQVVHLAAVSSAARSFEDPAGTFRINAIGTWNLLIAVRDVAPRARVLVVGSGEIYGPQPEGSRASEDTPFRPVSPYALSKAAADAMSEVAARSWNLDVLRVRAFAHTGPGQTSQFVVPAWAEQIARIERGEADPVLRVGNLEVTRDMSDVRDVVDAYLGLLDHGVSGHAYNVCRGEGVRLDDVARRLCRLAATPIRIEVDPARFRPADVPYLVGNPSRIEADIGWRATRTLDRTLADVLDGWRQPA